jgi:predicted NBD/HSP70 family sugar kinase
MNKIGPLARNRALILSHLTPGAARSRKDICAQTGLSPATVLRVTRQLLAGRILSESASAPRTGAGRPSSQLEISGRAGLVLGASLLGPTLRVLLLNLKGETLREYASPVHLRRGPEGVLSPLKGLLKKARRELPQNAGPLRGLGLAVPGQWDRKEGVSLTYPRLPEWKPVPLRALVEGWTGLPARLVGFTPALAVAEQAARAKDDFRDLVCVYADDHVGLGVLANGEALEGASGNAGEMGHMTVQPEGPLCYCGNTGCLEMFSSCAAVLEQARESEGSGPRSFQDVAAMAGRGHAVAQRILGRAATFLGIGVASTLNLLNPQVVVLNGRFFDAGDLVLEPFRRSLLNRTLPNSLQPVAVERSTLGPKAGALGAGVLAIRQALREL